MPYSYDTFFNIKHYNKNNSLSIKKNKSLLFCTHYFKLNNKIKRTNLARDNRSDKTELDNQWINVAQEKRMEKNKDNNNINMSENIITSTITTTSNEDIEMPVNENKKSHLPTSTKLFKTNCLAISPEIIAIASVYFVQGIVSLTTIAVTYFLKDEFLQDPSNVAWLEGSGYIPWVIKPIYGFISDSVPLFGYKRKSYLILCGILSSSAWFLLSHDIQSVYGVVLMLILANIGTACSDVVVDSIVVERVRGEPQSTAGSLQSLCWGSAAIGGIISSYSSGYLVQTFGPRFVFGIVAWFPVIVATTAFLIHEEKVKPSNRQNKKSSLFQYDDFKVKVGQITKQFYQLWEAFSNKRIIYPSIFLFIWMATPSAGSAMFFFETNELNFTAEFMGRIAFIGQIASLMGVGIYNFYLKSVPLRKVFFGSCLITTTLAFSQLILVTRLNTALGLSDKLFVIGDVVVLSTLGKICFMPVLVLAARICPEGVEASLFALLMSILNSGGFVASATGAGLTKLLNVTSTNFTNLVWLVALCTSSNFLVLPFLKLLPSDIVDEPEVKKKSELL